MVETIVDYKVSPWLWFLAEIAPHTVACCLVAWLAAVCRKCFPLTNEALGCAIPMVLMIPWLYSDHVVWSTKVTLYPPLRFSLLCGFAVVFSLGYLRQTNWHGVLAWFVLVLALFIFWASLHDIASQG